MLFLGNQGFSTFLTWIFRDMTIRRCKDIRVFNLHKWGFSMIYQTILVTLLSEFSESNTCKMIIDQVFVNFCYLGFFKMQQMENGRSLKHDIVSLQYLLLSLLLLLSPIIMKLSIDFFVHVGISGELCTGDVEQWFFFSPRQEREAHGGRPNRITPSGYWKATGSPCYVFSTNNKIIGLKKTMVFYEGRAPLGKKTKWKLNEYRALEEATSSGANPQVCNK